MNLIKNEQIASSASKSYQLFIWISETGQEQNSMMNKTFSAKILVEGSQYESKKLLTEKIIEDNSPVVTTTPNFANVATTDDGLIKGTDADGDTYYFRGDVEDNYVFLPGYSSEKTYKKCADGAQYYAQGYPNYKNTNKNNIIQGCYGSMWQAGGYSSGQECVDDIVCTEYSNEEITEKVNLFRIVRINGSGTTRIIANDIINSTAYNTNDSDTKYTGYTYTENGEEKDSTIKGVIDNWYTTKMTSADSYIAEERFCNDTSGTSSEYGALSRLKTNNHTPTPSFICPTTDKDYGGEYRLKAGLITADEIAFAGGLFGSQNSNFYIKKINGLATYMWPGSPSNSSNVFMLNTNGSLGFNTGVGATNGLVAPVSNLKSDVLYSSGSGTKSDPYVVSVS